jgi:hypothetical protein
LLGMLPSPCIHGVYNCFLRTLYNVTLVPIENHMIFESEMYWAERLLYVFFFV